MATESDSLGGWLVIPRRRLSRRDAVPDHAGSPPILESLNEEQESAKKLQCKHLVDCIRPLLKLQSARVKSHSRSRFESAQMRFDVPA
jgi:hypothetical protein